jgi:hypothetical protein
VASLLVLLARIIQRRHGFADRLDRNFY